MRTRLVRLVVVVLVLAGSLLTGEQPVSATAAGAARFYGEMIIPSGMGDRCLAPFDPFNCLFAPGRTSTFAFNSLMCVAGGAVVTSSDGEPIVPTTCVIRGTGVITGFCGHASATGSGELHLLDVFGRSKSYQYTWQLTWTGTQFTHNSMLLTGVITDGSDSGTITGRFSMTPDPFGGSCFNETATRWLIEADMGFEVLPPV